MPDIIMALDQGTTSSRTILFNSKGEIITTASEEIECLYPEDGWVEQRPDDLWNSQLRTMHKALQLADLKASDIAAIGITNQRETTVAWNTRTGQALGNAIGWQCRRTADYCEELKNEGFDKIIRRKTGLVTDAYFSGTKMRWMLQNNKQVAEALRNGELAFGTVDSWLIYKLTGGEKHITDTSNASRTLLFNTFEGHWDEELLQKFEIPLKTLPDLVDSSGIVAHTQIELLGSRIPIAGIAGDQQAALFGQACFEPGMAKNTYGTGCFLLMNTGQTPVPSDSGLLTTVGWRINGKTTYALEGAVFIAGALIQWLRDGLELFEDASQTEAMALSIPDSAGVFVVPAFVGLGAPYWDPYARGTIMGLTRDVKREHIVRASLEAIAFQSQEVLDCMQSEQGQKLSRLRVDGGACANNYLCQFQADLLNTPVSRPKIIETTAMGAAFLAGLAVGVFDSQAAIAKMWTEDKCFVPESDHARSLLEGWEKAVKRSQDWIQELKP